MTDWQPIDTLPLDDDSIILTDGKKRWFHQLEIHRDELGEWCGMTWNATHWLRLPPPPKEGE